MYFGLVPAICMVQSEPNNSYCCLQSYLPSACRDSIKHVFGTRTVGAFHFYLCEIRFHELVCTRACIYRQIYMYVHYYNVRYVKREGDESSLLNVLYM